MGFCSEVRYFIVLMDSTPSGASGYAQPEQRPLFLRQHAEIMAGRIPISETRARQPEGWQQVILGGATALEINWPAAGDCFTCVMWRLSGALNQGSFLFS